ncbi:MAG: ABC-2 family transporter protein [Proteobacteria bacterium]|nr:ABC-2 family transporter protein [Pseudomonadota bacterium]
MNGLRLYLRYASASLRGQAQYPASAALLIVGQFFATIVELAAVWALFERFGSVQGWRYGEVALFYGLVNAQFALADMLTRGFDVLGAELLRTGAFDRLLLRPRALTLQLTGHDVRLSRLGRVATGVVVVVFATRAVPIDWTAATVLLALWALAGGVALFCGILVLQATLAFWTIDSLEVANVLTYGGVEAGQYPLSIYERWFRQFLTFAVPLACVAYFPVLVILGRTDPLGSPPWVGTVSPAAGFMFLALSSVAWNRGVGHYASSGT